MTEGSVIACPECDETSKFRRCVRRYEHPQRKHDCDWKCDNCGTATDDPVRREAKRAANFRKGLSAALVEADPDEIARETTKPPGDDRETDQATQQESPGGSSQDDPGKDQNDLTQTDTSDSDKFNDRSREPSPSCGWRGVAKEMGVEPGR